jgi:hypothetical protein
MLWQHGESLDPITRFIGRIPLATEQISERLTRARCRHHEDAPSHRVL